MELINRKIVLGVTGGIAAYKSAYLTRLLIKAGCEVQTIMTEAGTKFVTPLTFESLTGRPVSVKMFPEDRFVGTHHITLADWPDLIVVAPATADFIAQITHGFCSSLLSAVCCATKRPILLAPAMNEGMFSNQAVQKNLGELHRRGLLIMDVGVGEMACKTYGPGRMAEPEAILERISQILKRTGPLAAKNVVVTAGPCREAIDPVRFISNRSSGKMGYAIASEAVKLGGNVKLISGPVVLNTPDGVSKISVETTEEMATAVNVSFDDADYLIMAAAPADYKPTISFDQKIKKCDKGMLVELSPTIDILKSLISKRRDNQVVVGFALETENEIDNAQKKLEDKKLDFIVVNKATEDGAGFDSDTNRVTVISKSGQTCELQKDDKNIIARNLWEIILPHE
ncbi:MAG: bifunctional phosphopantothenoylcysteine decarboxylase/phosphopantothenate--cysteine ligase CoaBC [candidate division Zixibacteria bacterium]